MLVHDLRKELLDDPLYAPIHPFVREASWDIVYSLPLVSRGRALGGIFFCFLPNGEPGEDERVFLRAVADQAAVAVENARLFSEARGKAALEERQRLARELHDSVSQALYGIALGARTSRTLLERDPQKAADPLDYVLSLSEAGLAEMRALIFELRPESLESEGLMAALEKQAAALRARHEIPVEADLCEEPEASLDEKEAVYRIAQEALHNVVKHARAAAQVSGCAAPRKRSPWRSRTTAPASIRPAISPVTSACARCASGPRAWAARWTWRAPPARGPGLPRVIPLRS